MNIVESLAAFTPVVFGFVVSVLNTVCVTKFGGGRTGFVFGKPRGVSCSPSRA